MILRDPFSSLVLEVVPRVGDACIHGVIVCNSSLPVNISQGEPECADVVKTMLGWP